MKRMLATLFLALFVVGPVTSLGLWAAYRIARYFRTRKLIEARFQAVGE